MNTIEAVQKLVKSKQRVALHGEVFTPPNVVNDMLNLLKQESERIDSRFLEPACGEGNFLMPVLLRKLETVDEKYSKIEFERRHYGLLALMSIYGIELLSDNAETCRKNLHTIFDTFIDDKQTHQWSRAAEKVLFANIVQADALTMKKADGEHIIFPEWAYLGKGNYVRRDFQYSDLTLRSSFTGTLFEEKQQDEFFKPVKVYNPITVAELAAEY